MTPAAPVLLAIILATLGRLQWRHGNRRAALAAWAGAALLLYVAGWRLHPA